MGDVRFDHVLDRLRGSTEPHPVVGTLTDEEVIEALAAASKIGDPYWSNVLATEATNRTHRLQSVLEVLDRGIIGLDLSGKVVILNEGAERLLRRPAVDVRGRDLHLLIHPDCKAGEECELAPRKLATHAQARDGVTEVILDGATRMPLEYKAFPIKRNDMPQGTAFFCWSPEPAPRALTFYYSQDRTGVALQNVKRLIARTGVGIELVDVDKDPDRAEAAHIIATPVLVRHSPLPERRLVGDMWDIDLVMRALELSTRSTGGQMADVEKERNP